MFIVYTGVPVASTQADKEGGTEPTIFIITRVYTNRIIIAITIFMIVYKLIIFIEIIYKIAALFIVILYN